MNRLNCYKNESIVIFLNQNKTMEESKVSDDFDLEIHDNDLKQCAYLLSKSIPQSNIITLSTKSIVVKHANKLVCLRNINNDLKITFICDGKKQSDHVFRTYQDIVSSIVNKMYI